MEHGCMMLAGRRPRRHLFIANEH